MSFASEFKEFITKGNVMDMAVGIIIGGAFTAIVTALTDNIITPAIQAASGGAEVGAGMQWTINGATIDLGAFIGAIINFVLIAIVLFCVIKGINSAKKAAEKLANKEAEEAAEAEARVCPFCKQEVADDATRCPHCTSEIPVEVAEAEEAAAE